MVVLVSEDAPFAYLMQRYAQLCAGEFRCISPHPEALEAVRAAQPTLIVVDLAGENSWTTLLALQNAADLRHTPIVVCSVVEEIAARPVPENTRCLLKPVMYADFCAVLTQVRGDLASDEALDRAV